MTRANINFIWQEWKEPPRTLYIHYNGDQYPLGLREYFGVLEFVSCDMTPERFTEWVRKYYETEPQDLGPGGQPRICYTNGFITDYTYVFDGSNDTVSVWYWRKLIFDGSRDEFIGWISSIRSPYDEADND